MTRFSGSYRYENRTKPVFPVQGLSERPVPNRCTGTGSEGTAPRWGCRFPESEMRGQGMTTRVNSDARTCVMAVSKPKRIAPLGKHDEPIGSCTRSSMEDMMGERCEVRRGRWRCDFERGHTQPCESRDTGRHWLGPAVLPGSAELSRAGRLQQDGIDSRIPSSGTTLPQDALSLTPEGLEAARLLASHMRGQAPPSGGTNA